MLKLTAFALTAALGIASVPAEAHPYVIVGPGVPREVMAPGFAPAFYRPYGYAPYRHHGYDRYVYGRFYRPWGRCE